MSLKNPYSGLDFDETHELEKPKVLHLSLHMIVKRHLPSEAVKWSQDEILMALNKITHLRLDREKIEQIDSLELLGPNITNVYLQHNSIKKIEGLETLQNLSFLTMASNKIRRIAGLSHLKLLAFLDLSNNSIASFDIDELPQSLVILSLTGNPCTTLPDYRGSIIQDLARLQQLDLEEVTKEERREAGYVVSSSGSEDDDSEEERPTVSPQTRDGDLFKDTAAKILLRSQSRVEEMIQDHKARLEMLDEMRDTPASTTPYAGSQSQVTTSTSNQKSD